MSKISNQTQLDVIDGFVRDLESSLGVEHQKMSFDDLWVATMPPEASGMSVQEYMEDVSDHLTLSFPQI